jgi:putative protease
LRVEFLDDGAERVKQTLGLYQGALAGESDVGNLWRALKATNHYGVTRGPLAVL